MTNDITGTIDRLKVKDNVSVDSFDTSYNKPRFLLSCGDKHWQISEFIYDIVKAIDGEKDIAQIFTAINKKYNGSVSYESVDYVINSLLHEKGVLAGTLDKENKSKDTNLWLRVTILKKEVVRRFMFLSFLYNRKLLIPLGIAGILSQFWFYIVNMQSKSYNGLFNTNGIVWIYLCVIMLVVALWHELGHAAASARYDSQPGDIGFGVYFIMPVFYSDVTRIWKLPRHQRVMVDLGGIYFQSFVMLAIYLTGVFLHNQYITFAVLMISLRMAFNLNPFIKMDGYWVLSDLIGIPNLQETTRNFIKTKTKQLLRMRYVPFVLNVNPKAKITFYLYLILSCAFFVYFAYWLILALHSAIVNLPSLYNTFKTIEFNNQIWWEYFINILVRVVYPNLIYFITIIFAVRYISPGFSKVFSLVKNGRTAKTKQTIQNDL